MKKQTNKFKAHSCCTMTLGLNKRRTTERWDT